MSQKVVFVAGASSGIGFALAKQFALRGYKVYAGSRKVEKMQVLQDEYHIITMKFDITNEESINEVKSRIEKENEGNLDLLYLNAGINSECSVLDITKEELENLYSTNVFGPILTVKAFQHLLLKAQGTVAITSTIASFVNIPFKFGYTSTKRSLDWYAQTLALEVGQLGIKVVNVRTGSVKSEIWDSPYVPPKDSIFYLGEDHPLKSIEPNMQDTDEYAKSTVDGVVKAIQNGGYYSQMYKGNDTVLARILTTLLPFKMFSIVFWKMLDMNDLFTKVKAKLGYN